MVAEIDDFDLDRSTAQAWAEFTVRLAEVISMIDDSADLTIRSFSASDDPPPSVRLSSPTPLAVRAARAGCHLLLEKPTALTVVEADAVAEACESAGVRSTVFFTARHVAPVERWITERAAQRIVADLAEAGIIDRRRVGLGRVAHRAERFLRARLKRRDRGRLVGAGDGARIDGEYDGVADADAGDCTGRRGDDCGWPPGFANHP